MRLRGQVGLSVARDSVRVGEPFLDRFPGRVDAYVWAGSTLKGSLTYVMAQQAIWTAMGF